MVDHGDFIDNAFGFRFNYKGHSVVLSGDTKYSENLIKNSKDVDVLIHEVAFAHPELIKKSPTAREIQSLHKARLIANDSVIAIQPIHIISNGWEPHIYRSDSDPEIVDLKKERFISNGQLHIDSNVLVLRNIDFTKRFHTRITNSQPFNLHSDNFRFSTRLKADRVFQELCPWMKLVIVTDVSSFSVSWTGKGCETKARYKLGEIIRSGTNHDLSALGSDLFDWQDLELIVENRSATIYLNGRPAYHEAYRENGGNIMALIYMFDGTGSIDHATLKDGNDKVVFRDTFDK